jgi:aminopeptidase YwaD
MTHFAKRTVVKIGILGLIVVLSLSKGYGQQNDSLAVLAKAKERVAILASKKMAGRGYQDNGARRASAWIAAQFQDIGLQPIAKKYGSLEDYFQDFRMRLNLVQDAKLSIGGRNLRVGRDFIVYPSSDTIGTHKPRKLSISYQGYGLGNQVTTSAGRAVILDDKPKAGTPAADSLRKLIPNTPTRIADQIRRGAAALILRQNKLTASFDQDVEDLPVVEVLATALPKPEKAKTVRLQIKAGLEDIRSRNVVGMIPGTANDSIIILCAHYDHLGRQGKAIFRGAHDNASGIAFLLQLAQDLVAHPLKQTVLIIAFGGEEAGLIGSQYFVRNPLVDLKRVQALYNFDLLGHGSKGIMAVGGTTYPQLYAPLKALNDSLHLLPQFDKRPNAPNSDHYPFTQVGIPALFFYTQGGPPHYHDIHDKPETLGYEAFYRMRALLLRFWGR